ncbi:hypothetical protein [Nocardia sp. NPDC050710]|uniref:hypothetical protein n=1 Tax=Nocardia sp. NPDC050710 TaxID=3157220 RepID=UPI0033FF5613
MELELPPPDVLLARIALADVMFCATVGVAFEAEAVSRVDGGRLTVEDGAGNWLSVVRYPGGRALLYGGDESSEVWERDAPYDPLADAPDWVRCAELTTAHPWLDDDPVGFVRWWEEGIWRRTPIDLDDGLFCGIRSYADAEEFASKFKGQAVDASWLTFDYESQQFRSGSVELAAFEALCAAAGRGAVGREQLDLLPAAIRDAAGEHLWRAGVIVGAPKVTEPLAQ